MIRSSGRDRLVIGLAIRLRQISALNSESFLLARLAAAGVVPRRAGDAFFRVCGCDGLRGPPPPAEEGCAPSESFGLWYKASGDQYARAVAAAAAAAAAAK